MAIPVSNIVDKVLNIGLDAEGSDHYKFDPDIKDALNAAVKWVVAVINRAYGDGKLGEEVFQEITYSRVFQTNSYSRVHFDETALGHSVWTILSVLPKITTIPSNASITSNAAQISLYRNDVTLNKVTKSGAKRASIEEWSSAIDDPFSAGYSHACEDIISYLYKSYSNYSSSGYSVEKEIELRPELSKQFIAVEYVAVPDEISTEADTIPFPFSLESLIFNKTQNLISRKQGDNTNIFAVTERDINTLVSAINGNL